MEHLNHIRLWGIQEFGIQQSIKNNVRCLIGIFLSFTTLGSAQNLVPNFSFEDYKRCPEGISDIEAVKYWYAPTIGTTDYFNRCNYDRASVPFTDIGYQEAFEGDGYCGIIVYDFDETKINAYREYLQVRLSEPLKEEATYQFSMQVSLAEKVWYATDNLEICLTTASLLSEDLWHAYPLNCKSQIRNPNGNFLDNREKWVNIQGVYIANGGEEFLTIGNFHSDNNTKLIKLKKPKGIRKKEMKYASYYYIDNVKLINLTTPETITRDTIQEISINIDSIEIGEPITLKTIYFEFNKCELLTESYTELNRLEQAMRQNALLEVKISGHTDNTGTEEYNLKLSLARAKAVVDYLVERGIESERITYQGYGSSKPKVNNATEEGRAVNRRVEFTILKK